MTAILQKTFSNVCISIQILLNVIPLGISNKPAPIEVTDLELNWNQQAPGRYGPSLNIKTVLSTYGDFHVKDKTAVRTSYL